MKVRYSTQRVFDENEYEREGRNGRMYRGRVGWRWLIVRDDRYGPVVIDDTRTKREALARVLECQEKGDAR